MNLSALLNLRDASTPGLSPDALIDDYRYDLTQEIGLAALERGVEGLLVPSATLLGDNLVVLVENLLPTSSLEVKGFVDPRLVMDRG